MKKYFDISNALEPSTILQMFGMMGIEYTHDTEANFIEVIVRDEETLEKVSEMVGSELFMAVESNEDIDETGFVPNDFMLIMVGTQEDIENAEFSKYRMDPDKEKMFNPEENIVDYGDLLSDMINGATQGVILDDDTINVSDDAKSKIADLLGDLDDDEDDDWMNED